MGETTHADRINTFLETYAQQMRRHRVRGGDIIARAGRRRLLGSKLRQLADTGPHASWAVRPIQQFLNALPPGATDVVAHAISDDGIPSYLHRRDIEARIEQVRPTRRTR